MRTQLKHELLTPRLVRTYTGVDQYTDRVILTTTIEDPTTIRKGMEVYMTDRGASDYMTMTKIKSLVDNGLVEMENGLHHQIYTSTSDYTQCDFFELYVMDHPDPTVLDRAMEKSDYTDELVRQLELMSYMNPAFTIMSPDRTHLLSITFQDGEHAYTEKQLVTGSTSEFDEDRYFSTFFGGGEDQLGYKNDSGQWEYPHVYQSVELTGCVLVDPQHVPILKKYL